MVKSIIRVVPTYPFAAAAFRVAYRRVCDLNGLESMDNNPQYDRTTPEYRTMRVAYLWYLKTLNRRYFPALDKVIKEYSATL